MGWKEKTDRAKRLHRPSLKDWSRDGLHRTFPRYAESMLRADAYQSFRVVVDRDDERGGGSDVNGVPGSVQGMGSLPRWRIEERSLPSSSEAQSGSEGGDAGLQRRCAAPAAPAPAVPAVLDPREVSPAEFHTRYEARGVPVVVLNLPRGDGRDGVEDETRRDGRSHGGGRNGEEKEDRGDAGEAGSSTSSPGLGRSWPAVRRWDLASLASDPDLRDRPFKVGEGDDGHTLRVKMRDFMRYLRSNVDDSPLYIFDATFDEDRSAKRLLADYDVPRYFDEDLFGLVGERRRPPYRWFLVGPARSGTVVHIDPLGTSAWNTLIRGVKRWVLFPPHVPKNVVKGRRLILPKEDDEAVHYFCYILPRIKRRAAAVAAAAMSAARSGGSTSMSSPDGYDYSDFECYEFNQYPGETVFIPHGWWHAVLNITDTVGITQNFCSSRNFDGVWTRTRSGRKKMACAWLKKLGESRPELARRAKELNRRDGFVMWEDDPTEQRRRRRKKAEKKKKERERRERRLRKEERERERRKKGDEEERRRGAGGGRSGDGDEGRGRRSSSNGSSSRSPPPFGRGCSSGGRDSKRSRVEDSTTREVSPD